MNRGVTWLLKGCRAPGGGGELFDLRYSAGEITGLGALEPAPGDRCLDLAGAHVVAGLVDAHVHLALGGGPLENAQATLAAGVTAVRDLGSPLGPTGDERLLVVSAGRALTRVGSYGTFLGVAVSDRRGLRAAAAAELAGGARVVKVIVSGSVDFGSCAAPAAHFGVGDVAAVVELARAAGVPVAAHANGPEAIGFAVAAGVDSIEHGIMIDQAGLEAMAETGIRWVPTLTPLCNLRGDPRWPRLDEVYARHLEYVGRGADTGVTVVAGSDAGSPGVPHGSLRTELGLLRGAGLTVGQVAAAAGTAAAALLGLEGGYGLLAVGSRTDLVWFASDPFAAPGFPETPSGGPGDWENPIGWLRTSDSA